MVEDYSGHRGLAAVFRLGLKLKTSILNLLVGCPRGAKLLHKKSFPLFFEGEGDKGGEVVT